MVASWCCFHSAEYCAAEGVGQSKEKQMTNRCDTSVEFDTPSKQFDLFAVPQLCAANERCYRSTDVFSGLGAVVHGAGLQLLLVLNLEKLLVKEGVVIADRAVLARGGGHGVEAQVLQRVEQQRRRQARGSQRPRQRRQRRLRLADGRCRGGQGRDNPRRNRRLKLLGRNRHAIFLLHPRENLVRQRVDLARKLVHEHAGHVHVDPVAEDGSHILGTKLRHHVGESWRGGRRGGCAQGQAQLLGRCDVFGAECLQWRDEDEGHVGALGRIRGRRSRRR